jgi:hypothetical protein
MSNPSPGHPTTVRGTAAIVDVLGVMLGKASDRTFLLHLGRELEDVRPLTIKRHKGGESDI